MAVVMIVFLLLAASCQAFILLQPPLLHSRVRTIVHSTTKDVDPLDYDVPDTLFELDPSINPVSGHNDSEDKIIREELKRELLLLASVSDRGLFLSDEEKDIVVDIITQLEALNPTDGTAIECYGEWDLVLTSTQAWRSSPFFQSIRSALNDKATADNAFSLHEGATSIGKVGRVKQIISEDGSFISEVELEVGVMPGMPFTIKGTVVSKASFNVVGADEWELSIQTTQVKKSNVPFLDQLIDDYPVELPVGNVYDRVRGSVPVFSFKTYFVDDSLRITRDVDDHFYVFSRV